MKINRRDFIKTGGMVMLGSLAVPSFLGSCTGNKVDQATGISFAQNHFGVSESDMKKVLAAALEKGGDYADLFFEHSYRNNIGLQDGAVNRASSNIDFGMGVRVVAGDQTGYAYVDAESCPHGSPYRNRLGRKSSGCPDGGTDPE